MSFCWQNSHLQRAQGMFQRQLAVLHVDTWVSKTKAPMCWSFVEGALVQTFPIRGQQRLPVQMGMQSSFLGLMKSTSSLLHSSFCSSHRMGQRGTLDPLISWLPFLTLQKAAGTDAREGGSADASAQPNGARAHPPCS